MEWYVCIRACVRAYVRTCMGGCVCTAKVVRMNPFVELKWKRAYCRNNIEFVNAAADSTAATDTAAAAATAI